MDDPGVRYCMFTYFAGDRIGPDAAATRWGDGNPDNTLAVPFSGYMNLLFLLTAVVYAMITLRRLQKKQVAILKK